MRCVTAGFPYHVDVEITLEAVRSEEGHCTT